MRMEPARTLQIRRSISWCLAAAALIASPSFVFAAGPEATDSAQLIQIEARTIYGPEKDMVALCSKFDLEPFITPPDHIQQASAEKQPLWPTKPGGMPPFRKVVLSDEETQELISTAQAHQRLSLQFVPKLTTHSGTTAKISLGKSVILGYQPDKNGQIKPIERETGVRLDLRPTSDNNEIVALTLDCEQNIAGPLKKMQGLGPDGKSAKIDVPTQFTSAMACTDSELAPGQSLLITGFTQQEGKKPQPMAILLRVVE